MIAGLPAARYVALLSLNQPVRRRMFWSLATVNSPREEAMYSRYGSASRESSSAGRTRQPLLSSIARSSFEYMPSASSNGWPVSAGRSRNLRNS